MKTTTQGFSLIELVIAIGILAFIMAMVIPGYNAYQKRAKISGTRAIITTFGNAIDMFHNDTGNYPTILQDLVDKPADPKVTKKWQGPYLQKPKFEDAWNAEIVYQVTKGAKHSYELYSWGPAGEGSPEDEHISIWDI
jgi:general secretion pathway protein G